MSSRINIIKYVKNLSIFFFGLLVFYAVIDINVYQKFKYVQLQFCSSRSENRMDDLGVIKSSRFFFISGATDLQLKYIKLIRNNEVKRMVIKSLNKFTKEQLGKNEIVPNTHGDNWTSLCTRYPRFLQRPRILVRWNPLYQPCKDLEKKTRRKVQYVWCLSTKKSFIAVDRLLRTMFDAKKSKADMVLQQQYLTDSFLWSVLISELDFKENIMQHMICLGSVSNSELIYSLLLQTTQKAKSSYFTES